MNTYILTFETHDRHTHNTFELIPLIIRPNGEIILAANDTLAYQIGLDKFYRERYEEEKFGQKAITTGFIIDNPDVKGHLFRYSLAKQNIDKSKEKLFRRNPNLKRFISK